MWTQLTFSAGVTTLTPTLTAILTLTLTLTVTITIALTLTRLGLLPLRLPYGTLGHEHYLDRRTVGALRARYLTPTPTLTLALALTLTLSLTLTLTLTLTPTLTLTVVQWALFVLGALVHCFIRRKGKPVRHLYSLRLYLLWSYLRWQVTCSPKTAGWPLQCFAHTTSTSTTTTRPPR